MGDKNPKKGKKIKKVPAIQPLAPTTAVESNLTQKKKKPL